MRWSAHWAALLFVLAACLPRQAQADRDLNADPKLPWVVGHSATSLLLVGGSVTLEAWATSQPRARVMAAFPFERHVEANFSQASARASDLSLLATMVLPLMVQFSEEPMLPRLGNVSVIYFEQLALTLFGNSVVKHAVRRSRPYVQAPYSEARSKERRAGHDAVLSFYSGHSAMSFAGAVGGSYLYAASSDSRAQRSVLWGVEISLASFTAHLRVRAGMHYWSDVAVGALLGSATAAGVVYAHQVRPRLFAAEWAAMSGGMLLGTSLAWLFPNRPLSRLQSWQLQPTCDPLRGVGMSAQGAF